MQYASWIISIWVFLLGIIFGSFLNAVVFRIHKKKSFLKGRSHCLFCKNQLTWYELIPLVSFLVQKGSCRTCKKAISWQYPLVEFSTGALFVLMFWTVIQAGTFVSAVTITTVLMYWFFVWVLTVLFVYDLRWQIIPDIVSLPAMGMVIAMQLVVAYAMSLTGDQTFGALALSYFVSAGWGVLIGGGFFLTQFLVSRGTWIGGGDIRLGVLMGLMLGWEHTVVALMLAYMIGALFAIGLVITGNKKWSSRIPFGTFLALATIVALVWGEHILTWYFNFL